MKVVAILGGLGSQMFKYAFYYALNKKEPGKVWIDTTYFLQNNSWNGYELEKLFNLRPIDIKDTLSNTEVDSIKAMKESYLSVCINNLLKNSSAKYFYMGKSLFDGKQGSSINTKLIGFKKKLLMCQHLLGIDFEYRDNDLAVDLTAYYDEYAINSDIYFRDYKDELISVFQFPKFDEKNQQIADEMEESASVALHIRRSDHLADNSNLIKNGYFQKAIDYIKKTEHEKLKFFVFSEDIEWCKLNLNIIGLNNKDSIKYIDWNTGSDSFRDMQLMTLCKHNVIPISSFSWWGYYLSKRTNKIVCAPKGYWLEVGNHF